MADFNKKMQMLAERGTPVGAEEMIERIEADMADEIASQPAEVVVVESMYDAYNAHDDDLRPYFASEDATSDAVNFWHDWLVGLNVSVEYECALNPDVSGGVWCEVAYQNDLAVAAGLQPVQGTEAFLVEDGRITNSESERPIAPLLPNLVTHMTLWLNETKPDVWAQSFGGECDPLSDGCVNLPPVPTWMSSTENGELMVELAPEFLAQSNQWPIGN